MKNLQDEAFVLGSQELGEADLIVTLLSRQHGCVRGVAASARRSRRRFGGLLEPLTHVRATWIERHGRELHRIECLDGVRSYATMQADPTCQAACAVLAELTAAFAHEGQAEPHGFRLLSAVLDALEHGGDPLVLVRYFEYWMLRIHGLALDLTRCSDCSIEFGADAPARIAFAGGVICVACAELAPGQAPLLDRGARELLVRFRADPPGRLPQRHPAAEAGGALERLLRRMLEAFAEKSFRTYRHLAASSRSDGDGL